MPRKSSPRDAFLNFKSWMSSTDATDSSVLVEEKLNTGLSIRGGIVWLIHLIERYSTLAFVTAVTPTFRWALCTVAGLATMPTLTDKGVVSAGQLIPTLLTSGASILISPHVMHYLPPIPVASPSMSLYTTCSIDNAAFRGQLSEVRVGFTTAPLDQAMYTEIAETWGY